MVIKIGKTKILIKKGNIIKQDTDAIVNAANPSLMGGGGVDGAIHRAGGENILKECKTIRREKGRCSTGEAVITTGGKLKADFVIHTVGPVWRGGDNDEDNLLKKCYINTLNIASSKNIKSLSFPSISTGAYMFPIKRASKIALKTVVYSPNLHNFNEIRFILFSQNDYNIYLENLKEMTKK